MSGRVLGAFIWAKFKWEQETKLRWFGRWCQNPRKAQWSFLEGLLKSRRETGFGLDHDFKNIRNLSDFQNRVPIRTWDQISPYVNRVIQGEASALFPSSEKIIMYAATSGTTGTPKFIPVTETSYRLYGKYWDHTWAEALRDTPHLGDGKILYFPGNPQEGFLNGIPYGAITARAYAQQSYFLRSRYPYPYYISQVEDYALRYYLIVRMALEVPVSFIGIANPSTILKIFRTAQERREEVIEDIRSGTLRGSAQLPEVLRTELLRRIRPNPRRARELAEIYQRTGDFLPRDYWASKHPMLIICFASGPMQLYLRQFPEFLGKYHLYDFGILASEGRLSFPIAPQSQAKGCCPTLEANFFEFMPEDQLDAKNPDVLPLEDIQEGKRYFIVFTNYSGLYRYHISDLVEVTGYFHRTPLFYFCNKGKHFSNITGEKLTEYQITECVRRASEKIGYPLEDFVCCLHWDGGCPCYSLLKGHDSDDQPGVLQKLVDGVEEELIRLNPEYHCKRQSLRLGPLVLKVVAGTGYGDYEQRQQRQAHNISQYKHRFLISDPDFEKQFVFERELAASIPSR